MPLRILVVDDHAVVRRVVRALLESHEGREVCGEPTTGRDAVEQSRRLRPDVVLMDLSLPELMRKLHSARSATSCVTRSAIKSRSLDANV